MINGDDQNHGNVQYHEFPRFWYFVRRNAWDTGAIFIKNVIPVILAQPILYQLPYGAKNQGVCFIVFSINYTIPIGSSKEDALGLKSEQLQVASSANSSRFDGLLPGGRVKHR